MPEIPDHNPDEVKDWQNLADRMGNWNPNLQEHIRRIIDERGLPIDLSQDETSSGHDVDQSTDGITLDRREIHHRHTPKGETEIVFQRHGKYIRNKNDPNAGKLTPEAVMQETETATRYFSELIAQVPESERSGINILFVSSDTSYANNGQRSYQTTEIAQQVAERLFQENGIPLENILNITPDLKNKPMIIPELREPQMFDQSPNFVEYMKQKYGDLDKDFWLAFEVDADKETRLAMGAEGPDEIADRLKYVVGLLAEYSLSVHQESPNSRLVIWAGTHYDTISPFVKRDILHKDKTIPVFVDYGGGVVIHIDQSGTTTAYIAGKTHEFSIPAK